MTELQTTFLENTDKGNSNSTIRQVLVDVEQLMEMLSNELDQNKSSKMIESPSYPFSLSTTMTNVTITDENDPHQIIEHLRHRINQLEYERTVLLSSYQLLIKLLK